jgi:hypothetical protein
VIKNPSVAMQLVIPEMTPISSSGRDQDIRKLKVDLWARLNPNVRALILLDVLEA